MRTRTLAGVLALVAGLALALPVSAHAQVFDKLKDAAEDAAVRESEQQVERLLREAIRCALNDPVCPREAEEEGEEAIFVDEDGEVITDEDGVPITDQDEARERAGVGAGTEAGSGAGAPGEGVWANYDFVPGDEILYFDDFSDDRVGDYPRRLGFVRGNWEVAEWEGRRLLRHTGPRHAAFKIALPEALPERFTIEFDVHFPHGNQQMFVATSAPESGNLLSAYPHNLFKVDGRSSGVAHRSDGPESTTSGVSKINEELVPVRIMVDGRYAKMYVDEQRVANIPVSDFPRGRELWFQDTYFADDEYPMYIGSIRVAAGGRDLYDDLLDDGRATTRGILFGVNSDRLRPESTPTLEAIGTMLTEHSELRLRVEGHTDADGDEAHNQQLSERRAVSVKRYLVEKHGVDASRLETAGLGESQPVADNRSAEGKQKNRRVELIRLEG